MTAEKADQNLPKIPDALPVLPLMDTVVLPMAIVPIIVSQERSVLLVDDVMRSNRLVALVARKSQDTHLAMPNDLYEIGTAAIIQRLIRANDGSLRLVVQGLERIRLLEYIKTEPYLLARVEQAPEPVQDDVESEALKRTLADLFRRLVILIPEVPNELANVLDSITDGRQMAYLIAATIPLEVAARQEVLEQNTIKEKLQKLIERLQQEMAVRELQQKIASETQEQLSKSQREYILREQIRTLQRELGEEDAHDVELRELRERLEDSGMHAEALKEAQRELERLERLPAASPEHGMIRSYLDWLVSLPWQKMTGGVIDIKHARAVLDEDHYNLERVKDRIIEYLAVKKLREERSTRARSTEEGEEEAKDKTQAQALPQRPGDDTRHEPILCFVGPPGVGKTSLGQSIARAMGRKFVRISLGGVHDEAEIRGHRRTYIGAMPGRIIQALRRVETADPVFMLDEIDKLGASFHGDPAAALLEVLDPAQNNTFVDTYLGVTFDLSRILFICTANTTDPIPPPLLDRMELVYLSGYTEGEKLHIARRYLLPKQIHEHGLLEDELAIDDDAIRRIIREYTREAGVRNLDRELAAVTRKVAFRISEGAATPIQITAQQIPDYLRRPRYFNEVAERIDRPGVATGLAWTPAGGDVLFVEAAIMPAQNEKLILTGTIGDVMRESAQTALSYLRSNSQQLDIDPKVFEKKVVHIHVPAGAIPKDGPSAGVTMLTALTSLALGKPVRNDVAMTGEITLRGKVLPVGGIREKVLAAYRAGIKTVILPQRNEGDLEDVPEDVRRELKFVMVDSAEKVLATVLSEQKSESLPLSS